MMSTVSYAFQLRPPNIFFVFPSMPYRVKKTVNVYIKHCTRSEVGDMSNNKRFLNIY